MAGNFAHTKTQSHKDMFATRSEIVGRNQLGGRRDPHRDPPFFKTDSFAGKVTLESRLNGRRNVSTLALKFTLHRKRATSRAERKIFGAAFRCQKVKEQCKKLVQRPRLFSPSDVASRAQAKPIRALCARRRRGGDNLWRAGSPCARPER
jgi:hypothetical protein